MEEQPKSLPPDKQSVQIPYEPPVAEAIEGPDPDSVAPGTPPGSA